MRWAWESGVVKVDYLAAFPTDLAVVIPDRSTDVIIEDRNEFIVVHRFVVFFIHSDHTISM